MEVTNSEQAVLIKNLTSEKDCFKNVEDWNQVTVLNL